MPQLFDLPPGAEVLGAMITPAVLITAAGSLVISTSNRLGRVVDRTRTLLEEAEGLDAATPADRTESIEKRDLIADQLARLAVRVRLLQTALMALYAAIGLLVGASLSLGLTPALARPAGWAATGFGLAGAAALLFASVDLVREVRAAVKSSLVEMAYTRKVVERTIGKR
jgi:hypothetical protein